MNNKAAENIEPWLHEGSIWKTQAAYFAWVRGQIRRGLWSRNPIKNYIKRQARKPAPKGSRAKFVITCEFCRKDHAQTKIEVDHIIPAGSLKNWEDIGPFMQRMLNPSGGYRLLCKPCHKTHTYAEKHGLSFNEASAHKQAIRIMKQPAKGQVAYMRKHGIWSLETSKNPTTRREAIIKHLNTKNNANSKNIRP